MRATFGQEVSLIVHKEESATEVFDAKNLRVDFDIRLLDGFSRGTVTIYNLSNETIKAISSGGNYVTLKTKLHGKDENTIANSFYISNVMEEKKIPNSVTTLYCFDKLRKQYLEKPVDIRVPNPTLRKEISQIMAHIGYRGEVSYHSFPSGRVDQASGRKVSVHQEVAQNCITSLQNTYKFKFYTKPTGMGLMYLPSLDELVYTTLNRRYADVKLHVENMRSNPVIGVASLLITSNLDGGIKPTSVVDISDLVTHTVGTDEVTLQLASGFLQDNVDGFSKYQVLTVQHKGSNYTNDWHTIATCTAPSKGKVMPPRSWHRGK